MTNHGEKQRLEIEREYISYLNLMYVPFIKEKSRNYRLEELNTDHNTRIIKIRFSNSIIRCINSFLSKLDVKLIHIQFDAIMLKFIQPNSLSISHDD